MKNHSNIEVKNVDIVLIDPPEVPDRIEINYEYVNDLAKSINEVGLLQPILLRPVGDRYEIIAGHMRYLATKSIGKENIRAIVRKMSDEDAAILRATENLQRLDLTPLEEALTFQNLIEKHGLKIEKVAKRFGKTPGTIKRRMDILKMPDILKKALHKKLISITVAEELWPIADETDLEYYLSFAIENGCTKEVARAWCKEWKDTKRREKRTGVEGGDVRSPYEPNPIYISCDICQGPMKLGEDVQLRLCPECAEKLKNALK